MLSIIKFPFNLALTSLCMSSCRFKSEYVELRWLQLRSNDGNDTGIVSTGRSLKVVFIVINWLLIQICENSNVSLVLWVTFQKEFNTIALCGNDKTYSYNFKQKLWILGMQVRTYYYYKLAWLLLLLLIPALEGCIHQMWTDLSVSGRCLDLQQVDWDWLHLSPYWRKGKLFCLLYDHGHASSPRSLHSVYKCYYFDSCF